MSSDSPLLQTGCSELWKDQIDNNVNQPDNEASSMQVGYAVITDNRSIDDCSDEVVTIAGCPYYDRSVLGTRLMAPDCFEARAWKLLILLVDVSFILLYVPYVIAIGVTPLQFDLQGFFVIICGTLVLLDPIVKLSTDCETVQHYERFRLKDGMRVLKAYTSTLSIYTDVLAAMVVIPLLILSCIGMSHHHVRLATTVLYAMLLPRGILFTLTIIVHGFTQTHGLQMTLSKLYGINAFIVALVVVNLTACAWLGIAVHSSWDNNWLVRLEIVHKPKFIQYTYAVFFSLTTMTTVGYGDMHPFNYVEVWCAIVIECVGVLFFSFIVGNVSQLIGQASRASIESSALREKMTDVNVWMDNRHFPGKLRKRVQHYYRDVWSHQSASEADFLHELPTSLRSDLVLHILAKYRQQPPLNSVSNAKLLDRLLSSGTPIQVMRGHQLCKEGDPADCMWMLLSGRIRQSTIYVAHNNTLQDDVVQAPSVIGETCILVDVDEFYATRHVTFTAETPCLLFSLSLKDIQCVAQVDRRLTDELILGMGSDLEVRTAQQVRGKELPRVQLKKKKFSTQGSQSSFSVKDK